LAEANRFKKNLQNHTLCLLVISFFYACAKLICQKGGVSSDYNLRSLTSPRPLHAKGGTSFVP